MSVSWRKGRAGGTLLLALVGAWLSHTAVYVHLRGAEGLREELLASPHRYMLPVAALIVVALGLLGRGLWDLWCDLGHRLHLVDAAIDLTRRGRGVAGPVPGPCRTVALRSRRLLQLLAAVAPLQLTLYVLQENLEASSAQRAGPGLSVLWSGGPAATLIHLAVALVLCSLTALLTRGLERRVRALAVRERLLRFLSRRLAPLRTAAGVCLEAPLDRFGPQLWSRPPPLPAGR